MDRQGSRRLPHRQVLFDRDQDRLLHAAVLNLGDLLELGLRSRAASEVSCHTIMVSQRCRAGAGWLRWRFQRRRLRSISMIRRSASSWVPTFWPPLGRRRRRRRDCDPLARCGGRTRRTGRPWRRAAPACVFDGRFPLRLGEDHHGGGLDVEPYSPGLDLADQDGGALAGRELVDHDLPVDRRVLPVSGPTARSARARRATGQPETLRQRNNECITMSSC